MEQIVAKILSNIGIILKIQNKLKMVPTYIFIGGSVENNYTVGIKRSMHKGCCGGHFGVEKSSKQALLGSRVIIMTHT